MNSTKIPIRCSSLTSQLVTCSVKSCAWKRIIIGYFWGPGRQEIVQPWKLSTAGTLKKIIQGRKSNHRLHPNLHENVGFQWNLLGGGDFNPNWKIWSSNWIISPRFGMKRNNYLETTTTKISWIYPQLPLRVNTRMFTLVKQIPI